MAIITEAILGRKSDIALKPVIYCSGDKIDRNAQILCGLTCFSLKSYYTDRDVTVTVKR